jgi:hypothetical protein
LNRSVLVSNHLKSKDASPMSVSIFLAVIFRETDSKLKCPIPTKYQVKTAPVRWGMQIMCRAIREADLLKRSLQRRKINIAVI